MISFLTGLVVGAGGMVAKDKILDQNSGNSKSALQIEADRLSDENEKLRSRLRDAQSQVENLMADNERLRRKSKDFTDDKEDLSDDLESAKKEIKKLMVQNDDLARKIQEYKSACDSYEQELKQIKG